MNGNAPVHEQRRRRTILDLTYSEACDFLLKPESYCSLDLPPYVVFDELLGCVHQFLDGNRLSDFRGSNPRDYDGVNYTILHNKDGRYAWRPFQLIHPALYVSLAHAITEQNNWDLILDRFQEFSTNDRIRCLSLPVISDTDEKDRAEQVTQWWREVEQRSIELSLDYDYLLETDVTDCYGAIYTHSIAWALHGKAEAKQNRRDLNLIGNLIDAHIQDMRHGQTNGIPQGSVLMDFIAEMVLGLADLGLSKRIQQAGIDDFKILRYRDDYRIFINSPQIGDVIAKLLTEVTTGLGLKLSPAKTRASSDVVRASIKDDKLAWLGRKQTEKSLQKHLLIIHDHANQFPNAGSLVVALNDFHKRLSRHQSPREHPNPLIAITVDIAFRNPRTYAICAAILSKLLSFIESPDEKLSIAKRIQTKFAKLPNTGHMQIWLQRVTLPLKHQIDYDETICRIVAESEDASLLWSSEWISSAELKEAIRTTVIVDAHTRDEIAPIIPLREVELFLTKEMEGYYG